MTDDEKSKQVIGALDSCASVLFCLAALVILVPILILLFYIL